MLKLVRSQVLPKIESGRMLSNVPREEIYPSVVALDQVDPDAAVVIWKLIQEYPIQESVMAKTVNLTAQKYPGLWAVQQTPMQNPRPPAAPGSLNLNLEQYYAACAVMGAVSAHQHQGPPDMNSLTDWACDVGDMMAKKAKQRWPR